jgi:predicted Zn-dependent peptidase
MKNLKVFLMSCLVMFGMSAQAKDYHYQAVKGDLMNTRIYTLDNGLKVYLSVNKEKPRIQTYIAVRTGSRNDPAETTGLAHYLEHLMFKGTKKFGTSDPVAEAPLLDSIQNRYEQYRHITDPAQRKAVYHKIDSLSQVAAKYNIPNEYDKLMASIGASGTNAYTSNDVTCYTEDIPANEVENWARVQSDRFQNMVIRGFHTELEAVYEEYNIGLSNDGEKEWDAMNAKLFPHHPYGTQTTIGTQAHLKNPSIVNIKNYFHRYYVPNNVAICMAGDFDPDKVIATIDQYFGGWQPSTNLSRPEFAPVAKLTAPADTSVVGQEAENVMLGWKFDGAASLQADTLDIISDMLSNGKAGLMDLDLDQKMKYLGGGAGVNNLADYSTFIMEGRPKEGQTLDEVKSLMLGELDKLKKGQFADDLIQSVVNNKKADYYRSLENNRSMANYFVDAFINGKKWDDVVGRLDRISHITKAQVVAFANKYFDNGYACVYKKKGEDTTQKKIDKPAITPIPANRNMSSQFLNDVKNAEVAPIQPRFLDFKKDLTVTKTTSNLPLLYKQNVSNGLFTMAFVFDFGNEDDNRYNLASQYIDYLGTDKMSAEKIKQEFYKLACGYYINTSSSQMSIVLYGLNENMQKAMNLMENLLNNAKVDKEAYNNYVDLVLKARKDDKLSQETNFSRLRSYGIYGPRNAATDILSEQQLKTMNPQTLLNLMKGLNRYKQTLLYYGPSTVAQLDAIVTKGYKTPKTLLPVPQGKEYTEQTTPKTEILLAPYDAKNIYMIQYHNENKQWDPATQPVVSIFNEYFGGGMNTVVFQELRETRGLAYSAYADYATPSRKNHPEYGFTYIISQNDKMMDCIHTFNNILDTIPQSQSAFELAKQALTKSLAAARTTKFSILNRYYWSKKMGLDYDINEKVYNALPSLTLNDIVKFEQQNMANKTYKYLILGDEKNLDIKSLEKIAPIKRVTTQEIFGY